MEAFSWVRVLLSYSDVVIIAIGNHKMKEDHIFLCKSYNAFLCLFGLNALQNQDFDILAVWKASSNIHIQYLIPTIFLCSFFV